mmetsp:Transcript_12251/g.17009  ORF Transcript_12251/g.17009 Transcript_12251/m.17009 type:complete len:366 (-) Transcript_12251:1139-2236(-)
MEMAATTNNVICTYALEMKGCYWAPKHVARTHARTHLVVRVLLDKVHLLLGALGRAQADEVLPDLVVDHDEHGEGERGEPVHEADGPGADDAHTRGVEEDASEDGLLQQPHVQNRVPHALVVDAQPAGPARDDVGPLHDHDGHEEGRLRVDERLVGDMARLGVVEHALLEVDRVVVHPEVHRVDGARGGEDRVVAVLREVEEELGGPQELPRWEAIVAEHDEVRVEPGGRLDDADLQIRKRDELSRDEPVGPRVARGLRHDVGLLGFVGEGDGGEHVRSEVDEQDEHGGEAERDLQCDEDEERRDLGDVRRQRVRDGLLEVVEDQPPLLHAVHDGREVVIEQDHVRRVLGHVRADDPHSDSDVGL